VAHGSLPSPLDEVMGAVRLVLVLIRILKCLVFYGENGQNIFYNNLFIYKHCINCVLHRFILISIYKYISRLHIYPLMDPVNPQYIYNVVFVKENYFGGKTYTL